MEGTYERYKLIYDSYAARICFGRCAFGDSLPAIPRIASEFHVAVPTVRSALARLEADGLIRVEAKKAARVVYPAGPPPGRPPRLFCQCFFLRGGFWDGTARRGFAALRPAARPLPKAQCRLKPPQRPTQSSVSPTK